MRGKNKRMSSSHKPAAVLRLRHAVGIVVVLAAAVLVPLAVVWKQVYVTGASMEQRELSDSLAVLRRESERLRLAAEGLSEVGRIERIARERLGLEYPKADRIVIMGSSARRTRETAPCGTWEFFAILRRSLRGDKG